MAAIGKLNHVDQTRRTRAIAAAIGAVVVFDVAWVRAPFLLILGVPFLVAAWRYRGKHTVTTVALVVSCLLYVAIGVSYALSNGLHGPAEPGEATSVINPGDFAAIYVGTPLAAWLAVTLAAGSVRRRGAVAEAVAL
jgi:hypothetical protein